MAKSSSHLTEAQRKVLEDESCLAWIQYNKMKNNKGAPMEWTDRPWMLPIIADDSDSIVVRKGAQIGMSTAQIFRTTHRCRRYNITYLYVLPTRDDVYEFTPQKVDPILRYNKIPTSPNLNTKEQKIIGEGERVSFLVFKGSFKEHEAIMIDGDGLAFDEVDKCNQGVLDTYHSRIQASPYGWEDYFSTPTFPDFGIDEKFQETNQMHWFIWCSHCGEPQYLSWPESVCYERKKFVCKHCGGEITDDDRRIGEWVKKYQGRDANGYFVSQMMAPWISAESLIKTEKKKGRQYFYNYCLGLPYAGSEVTVSEAVIYKNLLDSEIPQHDLVMGVDPGGARHHYVIGNERGVVEIGSLDFERDDEFKGFDLIGGKMREYDIRTCVIDGLPHTEEAMKLAKDFPFRIFLCFYRDRPMELNALAFDDEKLRVQADRQRTLDSLIDGLYAGEMLFSLNEKTPQFDEYVKHWKSMFLKEETDRYGQVRKVWSSGERPNHYVHASNYFRMALGRNKLVEETLPVEKSVEDEGKSQAQKMLERRLDLYQKGLGLSKDDREAELVAVLGGGGGQNWYDDY